MGGKTRETFNKRQKERDKIAKRQQRKSERPEGASGLDDAIDWTAGSEDNNSDDSVSDEA